MSFWLQYPHLQFDEATHVYTWNGKQVPSVTGIFDRVGHRKNDKSAWVPYGCPDFAKREHDSVFGHAFHKMANAMVCGKEVSFPEEMLPWHEKIKMFIERYRLEPLFDQAGNIISEYPMYSLFHGYCGTPDFCCRDISGKILVLDWKSSGIYQKSYSLQTAGYALILRELFGGVIFDKREKIVRCTVLFSPDKEYPEPVFRKNNPEDFINFQSILNTFKLAA